MPRRTPRSPRIVRHGGRHDLLTIVGALVVGGLLAYMFWLGPKWRREAAHVSLAEAAEAFARGDCPSVAAAIEEARHGLDTLPSRSAEIGRYCSAFLDAPGGGVARFLAHTVEHACAGEALEVTDDRGRSYGAEFFALIDSSATRTWGDAAVQAAVPEELRARHVRDFRFALCHTVTQSTSIQRCPFTLFQGGAPRDVFLTRTRQRWRIRVVDVTTGRAIAAREFSTTTPGPCDEQEGLLNTDVDVVTGPLDTTRFAAWLRTMLQSE